MAIFNGDQNGLIRFKFKIGVKPFPRVSFFLRRSSDTADSMIVGMSIVTPALATMVLLMMVTCWGSLDHVAAGAVSPVESTRQLSDRSSCSNSDDALDPTRVR